ncbi:hypothetical protein SSAG_02657 [Streptomyces sp. Mg1]|nr:hypothetical protein SSAG_02657 [Streptomyces sp. Mg1]
MAHAWRDVWEEDLVQSGSETALTSVGQLDREEQQRLVEQLDKRPSRLLPSYSSPLRSRRLSGAARDRRLVPGRRASSRHHPFDRPQQAGRPAAGAGRPPAGESVLIRGAPALNRSDRHVATPRYRLSPCGRGTREGAPRGPAPRSQGRRGPGP